MSILDGEVHSPASPRSASTQDITTTAPSHSSTTHGPPVAIPKPVSEVLKVVYQTKCALVRVSFYIQQSLSTVYPEYQVPSTEYLGTWTSGAVCWSCSLKDLSPPLFGHSLQVATGRRCEILSHVCAHLLASYVNYLNQTYIFLLTSCER